MVPLLCLGRSGFGWELNFFVNPVGGGDRNSDRKMMYTRKHKNNKVSAYFIHAACILFLFLTCFFQNFACGAALLVLFMGLIHVQFSIQCSKVFIR